MNKQLCGDFIYMLETPSQFALVGVQGANLLFGCHVGSNGADSDVAAARRTIIRGG